MPVVVTRNVFVIFIKECIDSKLSFGFSVLFKENIFFWLGRMFQTHSSVPPDEIFTATTYKIGYVSFQFLNY